VSKNISITLSIGSINKAIKDLERYQARIERKSAELVNELVDGGAEMAKYAFGNSVSVEKVAEDGVGIIEAVGDAVMFMEFGAGMATMENHPMASNAPADVYRWSYSEQVGSGEGYYTAMMNGGNGYWHFGGKVYSAVYPRHGLLDARDYIVNNAEAKARGVFSRK